ncbi:hypothetical protein [Herbaspirillum sp. alder98]|uniref:hypothetical protein n=1 Tax=Herbaspirillum sp. alder98 TaxID=2913096 RepID=UPI001CD8D39D|nr:hypothetical protein [Herbaspirillum sp. alder98]MCA1325133.1 hypothetical protein [Herbaspirillum sp. alder98]
MNVNVKHLGLSIETASGTRNHRYHQPDSWPPSPTFPVVINKNGAVISRYADSIWNISIWAQRARILNFGDGPNLFRCPKIDPANANLLRQIAAWWIYGNNGVRSATTLAARFTYIRGIVAHCSRKGILASDLYKFPAVVDEIINSMPQEPSLIVSLHGLFEVRDKLGFAIFDREALTKAEASRINREQKQTPYIPPRIWLYQFNRLKEFLEDFHSHREQIEACYKYCLDAYICTAGSLVNACKAGEYKEWGPFWTTTRRNGKKTGKTYIGPFEETAIQFGIDSLLRKWVINGAPETKKITLHSLSKYFSMVGYVGLGYILNLTLMRVNEGWCLKTNCVKEEQDPNFGQLVTIQGRTTKTIKDNDARWPASHEIKTAVDAMACISHLRMICADVNPEVPTEPHDIYYPYLIVRAYEPWGSLSVKDSRCPLDVRSTPFNYSQVKEQFANLFSDDELTITADDLEVARLITPSLDSEQFEVGKIWTLSWHQLRRTGAVNMQASGLISDSSLQYLLKHSTRAMSLYYGQGYSRLGLNKEAEKLYIRTMHEILGKEISALFSERYISPHGIKRKNEILGCIDPKDDKNLVRLAATGAISYRETLLGGCTKRGPCAYGGIDTLVHCAGNGNEPPCANALYDSKRAPELKRFLSLLEENISLATMNSPHRSSLEAQVLAIRKALNVIET